MKYKKEIAFDLEVFPNLFSVVFFDLSSEDSLEDISKIHGLNHPDVTTFYFTEYSTKEEKMECMRGLSEYLSQDIRLVGFNNLMYDNPVMDNVVYHYPTNQELFEFSSSLIARMNGGGYNKYEQSNNWDSLDLMKMQAFDALGVSLKQSSINLQWHRVQDLPLPFDHILSEDEVEKVLDYNLNDVLITAKLYRALEKEINLRRDLSDEYGINLLSASDSKMANLMLEDIYTKESGIPLDNIKSLRTQRDLVWLRQCVGKGAEFKTKALRNLKRKIDNTVVVREGNFSFKEHISFGGVEYDIGVGGLHSVDTPNKFYTDDEYIIQDADVASYYPNIILNNDIIPEHLDEHFIRILGKITEERVQAKKSDPVKAAGLKITVNSVFGKLNSDTFWLQDAKAMLSVTLSGQLYLLMLIEELHLNGIPTVSANTDGIVCKIPRKLEDKYYKICQWWENTTGFELEYTPYQRYIRSDVNNYITDKGNGDTKEKGRYTQTIGLRKGYKHPIVPRALYQYLINDVPIMDTLLGCDNILDFCISQKSGSKFQIEFHQDGSIEVLQKNNRFYVSLSGGKLIKRNKTNHDSTIGIMASEEVQIINDYDKNVPIEEYGINYGWYETEVRKYTDPIDDSKWDDTFYEEEIDYSEQEPLLEINSDAKIVPAKFRFSSGAYNYDDKTGNIYRGVADINYLTADTGELMYSLRDNQYDSWVDFLIDIVENSYLNSRQIAFLTKIGFFSEFGSRKKLLEFYENEFTSGKFRYNKNHKEATKEKRIPELEKTFSEMSNEEYKVGRVIRDEMEVLGFIQTAFEQFDWRYKLVVDLDTTYSPKINFYTLCNGETPFAKIRTPKYSRKKFKRGDVIRIKKHEIKNKSFKNDDGEWVDIPNEYVTWIQEYDIMYRGIFDT